MSKFKVGDKVKIKFGNGFVLWLPSMHNFIGKTATVSEIIQDTNYPEFKIEGCCYVWNECDGELVESAREFIVIRRDGQRTIAELRHGREVVKSAEAKCLPTDTFDFFKEGAPRAFNRLMGRETLTEKDAGRTIRVPLSEEKTVTVIFPQPAPMFKVGDRVQTEHGTGIVVDFVGTGSLPYTVQFERDMSRFHSGKRCYGAKKWDDYTCYFYAESSLSPAPEPKYYSGKVFAVRTLDVGSEYPERIARNGRVFEIRNGTFVENVAQYKMEDCGFPYKSFADFCDRVCLTEWAEVRE